MTTIIAIWRHVSTSGNTHRHMMTHFPIWRQASQRRDSHENLITFCIQLVPVRMLSKRWQAGEIKKGKSGSVATLSSSKMAERATAMLSLLFCRALVILVALPRYASPSRNSSRATARHLVVQCKLSRPKSRFRDSCGMARWAAPWDGEMGREMGTAVAKVVQQAHCPKRFPQ